MQWHCAYTGTVADIPACSFTYFTSHILCFSFFPNAPCVQCLQVGWWLWANCCLASSLVALLPHWLTWRHRKYSMKINLQPSRLALHALHIFLKLHMQMVFRNEDIDHPWLQPEASFNFSYANCATFPLPILFECRDTWRNKTWPQPYRTESWATLSIFGWEASETLHHCSL